MPRLNLLLLAALCFAISCTQQPDPLFEKIPSRRSKIHFQNLLSPNEALNAFTFTNFYNGGGVGVGDFNRDSLPDLFFTGNQVSSALYLNEGAFQFKDITEKSGIRTQGWCSGVAIVDINQDGWDDIYLSVAQGPGLSESRNRLYINQKTNIPSFKESAEAYGLAYEGFSTQSVFFDYDLDGDLDAFLLNTAPDLQNPSVLRRPVNNGTYPSTDKLYRNEGLGPAGHPRFTEVSREAGILYEGLGLGVVVSDLNQDGYPDLYCSNDFMSSDILYLNQGDGTFRNVIKEATQHTSLFGMGIDAGDLNNDSKIDLLQLDMLPADNARQKQMLGKHDYDKKELSVHQYGYQRQYMRNTLQINTGNQEGVPMFSELGLLAGVAKTDWSWAALLADLDNDQHKDIFITTGYRKNITDLDFIHYYQGSTYFGDDASKAATREQLLSKVPEVKLNNCAFRNTATLQFQDVSATWGLNELSYANGAAYADLDRDGDLDLIVNNIDAEASLFKNHTVERGQNHYLRLQFKGEAPNRTGIGANVKVWIKGKVQLFEHYPVRGYLSCMEGGLLIGLGKARQIDSLRVSWSPGREATYYNIAANQTLTLDIQQAKSTTPRQLAPVATLFHPLPDLLPYQHQESADFIDFNQTFALHKMLSKNGAVAATGDLNGDQLPDVVLGGAYRGSPSSLFFQQPNGQFSSAGTLPVPTEMEVGALHLFDADQDGDQDILVAGGSNERPSAEAAAFQPLLLLNDGKGQFSPSALLPKLKVSSQCIQTLDFDQDGDLDVFIGGRQRPKAYPLPANSYLLRNDGGRFQTVDSSIAPDLQDLGLVCDALALDYDQDGDEDLILVGEWMPLTLLENRAGRFVRSSVAQSSGWWNSLAAGDFDQDGDLDLLLGNEGLNTFYRASPTEPIQIAAKDFNADGQVDPLLGYFIQGQCVPALPRDALSQQIVQFRRKFTRYADYARVGFDDLFPKKDWRGAYRQAAQTLQSAYAINKGSGQFVLNPLPLAAQVAPIYGFLVKDFDGDGHLDALATGNFFANEAHLGQQDASQGIYLRGNGQGVFQVLPNEKTGLHIRGDARRSYWIDNRRFFTVVNGGRVSAWGL